MTPGTKAGQTGRRISRAFPDRCSSTPWPENGLDQIACAGHGARFRNDIVTGVGGRQILLEDPSGNPVELFEPAVAEARLSRHSS